jgi:hypothetical protein
MNRAPSVAKLMSSLGISKGTAFLIRSLLQGDEDTHNPHLFPSTSLWIQSCVHHPQWEERVMYAINEIIGGHGTHRLYSKEKPIATYISLDDIYTNTIILDNMTGRTYITSLADYVAKRKL